LTSGSPTSSSHTRIGLVSTGALPPDRRRTPSDWQGPCYPPRTPAPRLISEEPHIVRVTPQQNRCQPGVQLLRGRHRHPRRTTGKDQPPARSNAQSSGPQSRFYQNATYSTEPLTDHTPPSRARSMVFHRVADCSYRKSSGSYP
jgi:hypothetical protein